MDQRDLLALATAVALFALILGSTLYGRHLKRERQGG
jgi:hypothetical protein